MNKSIQLKGFGPCFNFLSLSLLFTGLSLAHAGSISGTVKWNGPVPKLSIIKMDSDPTCMAKHKEPPKSQALVLGSGNTMANIFVWVTSGLPKGKKYEVPKEPLVVDQNGCNYAPHVFGVMTGREVQFKNSDGIQHNVHGLPKENRQFNISMNKNMVMSKPKKFKKVEDFFIIKCDIHPWMQTNAIVLDHPYFSVTSTDGKFKIDNLPDGEYEVAAWHEKLGKQTGKVKVSGGDQKFDFTFSKK